MHFRLHGAQVLQTENTICILLTYLKFAASVLLNKLDS